ARPEIRLRTIAVVFDAVVAVQTHARDPELHGEHRPRDHATVDPPEPQLGPHSQQLPDPTLVPAVAIPGKAQLVAVTVGVAEDPDRLMQARRHIDEQVRNRLEARPRREAPTKAGSHRSTKPLDIGPARAREPEAQRSQLQPPARDRVLPLFPPPRSPGQA